MQADRFILAGPGLGAALVAVGVFLALPATLHPMNAETPSPGNVTSNTMQRATFGGGCFWCTETVFENVPGVKSVVAGYAGGRLENPTYKQVCSGETGHAEVIQVEFDPTQVTYEELLEVFWQTHDPTTLNRQGPDTGTQYRSVIFYHDPDQKTAAEKSKKAAARRFQAPIVTEIAPLAKFYPAEDYHQDFFRKNPGNPYCSYWIPPKLKKLDEWRKRGSK